MTDGDAPATPGSGNPSLLESLKRVATLLRDSGVRFALAGSAAVYARGGPVGTHDVDFVIRPDDVAKALAAAKDAGMRTERPPEDWLVKIYDGENMVDLIFRFHERAVDDTALARAEVMRVAAVSMPVIDAGDLLVAKLLALSAHDCDFAPPLLMARFLREQIDWHFVRRECRDSPYAQAFLLLVGLLDIADTGQADATHEEEPWATTTPAIARAMTST